MPYSAKWFKDTRRIAVCGSDGYVGVWTREGQKLQKFAGHTGVIQSVAISPDQTRLATAGMDGTVKIWDVASGADLLTLAAHRGGAFAIIFSPDGHRLISTGADRSLRIWDATLTPEMRYHRAAVELINQLKKEVLVKDEVIRRLRDDKSLNEEFRTFANKLADEIRDDPAKLNEASWAVVSKPGATPLAYALAVRQAEVACRLSPESGDLLNTLAWAYVRAGEYRLAIDALTRAELLYAKAKKATDPADLAPLAMAQYQLNLPVAQVTLRKLRDLMQDPRWAMDKEMIGFLSEVEALFQSTEP